MDIRNSLKQLWGFTASWKAAVICSCC